MANLSSKIIKLKAKEYNKKRKLLCPANSYAWLLTKKGFEPGDYNKIFELDNWYYKWNDYKGKLHIYVATESTDFRNALEIASDITVNGFVYEIDKRDVIPPDGTKPWWEFYVIKGLDTFTPDDLP